MNRSDLWFDRMNRSSSSRRPPPRPRRDAILLFSSSDPQGQKGLVPAWPLVPGIDAAGVVTASDDPAWAIGDTAVLTGNKIGQHFDGGYATQLRAQAGDPTHDHAIHHHGARRLRNERLSLSPSLSREPLRVTDRAAAATRRRRDDRRAGSSSRPRASRQPTRWRSAPPASRRCSASTTSRCARREGSAPSRRKHRLSLAAAAVPRVCRAARVTAPRMLTRRAWC